jgi:patatin-like phospholipase/acyl hydrolase
MAAPATRPIQECGMKRVLTLDGGGVRGVLPASFLAAIEEQIGRNPADFFDLIVGTSTGGIIALGFGAGFSAEEMRNFYIERGPRIFSGQHQLRTLRQVVAAKYNPNQLRKELDEVFGNKLLGESRTRLVIPSMDLTTGKVRLWKTAHHERFGQDYKRPMVEAAMATSAAPTYFRAVVGQTGTALVDGGVFANNPAALGAVEAIGVLGWPREDIAILSLGCGSAPLDVRPSWRRSGFVGLALKIASVFITAQSNSSSGMATHLLGDRTRFYRVDPPLPAKRYGLDVAKAIPELRGIGDSEARHRLQEIRDLFFSTPAEQFVPAHALQK